MKKLTALLGLAAITMHNSNIFGTGKNYAKLDEDQLQKIEDALAAEPAAEDPEAMQNLQSQLDATTASVSGLHDAISEALALNGLQITKDQTPADAIALLGSTCKEYGASKERGHNKPENTGQEPPEEPQEVYAFENVMNDMSKYPTLK